MFILEKLPKGSMVSADADIARYVLNIGIEGAFIPYDGTEKKVEVCVVKSIDSPRNPYL
jgi:hypothetical protein